MKPKKLCQRCGDPATWYSNVSGEDLCTPHYNAERRFMEAFGPCDDVVSEARPMRPWKWDAKAFKSFQGSTDEEESMLLSVLQQHGSNPPFIPSAFFSQPVQPLQGSTLLRMLGFPF